MRDVRGVEWCALVQMGVDWAAREKSQEETQWMDSYEKYALERVRLDELEDAIAKAARRSTCAPGSQ